MPSDDDVKHMRLAVEISQNAPLRRTNYRVGAVLVDAQTRAVLATGYTLELPGNTHAEECALAKYHATASDDNNPAASSTLVLYTTMEPCVRRLSGKMSCVERILALMNGGGGRVERVCVGVREPDTFVGGNDACRRLQDAGIVCEVVPGFEEEIGRITTAGHHHDLLPDEESKE